MLNVFNFAILFPRVSFNMKCSFVCNDRLMVYKLVLSCFLFIFRGDSKAGDGFSGPFDPLAVLCPYELMGSCQDEECSYQHHTKTTAT
jgi:hypothetical protein